MPIETNYQGILFPDRAESLQEQEYSGYRVFLDFWTPLSNKLREFYEGLALRRDTRAMLVYGPQGGGKTMFARKLASDFERTPRGHLSTPDPDNLWHRIAGGTSGTHERLDADLIQRWRNSTALINISNEGRLPGQTIPADRQWLSKLLQSVGTPDGTVRIVILDNAEQGHFIQSLLEVSDAEFIQHSMNPQTNTIAAQRFVSFARIQLRGCLFILLTNNSLFAQQIEDGINSQHAGMVVRANLPLPGPTEKETVVRVNTNRLNRISYWYCLDRAGPAEKKAIHQALSSASTFPASFAAVDFGIRSSSRQGRRARSCLLTLVVLAKTDHVDPTTVGALGTVWRTEIAHSWMSATLYESNWAQSLVPAQDAALLESEWVLRVVVLGEAFLRSLLSGDPVEEGRCAELLGRLKISEASKPGTWQATLDTATQELRDKVDSWSNLTTSLDNFWSRGQNRSTVYEPVLARILPGYNQGAAGFLGFRPDLTVTPFTPCSILSARTDETDDINTAIYRDAHVMEFTAIQGAFVENIRTYLRGKLPNYVRVTREQ